MTGRPSIVPSASVTSQAWWAQGGVEADPGRGAGRGPQPQLRVAHVLRCGRRPQRDHRSQHELPRRWVPCHAAEPDRWATAALLTKPSASEYHVVQWQHAPSHNAAASTATSFTVKGLCPCVSSHCATRHAHRITFRRAIMALSGLVRPRRHSSQRYSSDRRPISRRHQPAAGDSGQRGADRAAAACEEPIVGPDPCAWGSSDQRPRATLEQSHSRPHRQISDSRGQHAAAVRQPDCQQSTEPDSGETDERPRVGAGGHAVREPGCARDAAGGSCDDRGAAVRGGRAVCRSDSSAQRHIRCTGPASCSNSQQPTRCDTGGGDASGIEPSPCGCQPPGLQPSGQRTSRRSTTTGPGKRGATP